MTYAAKAHDAMESAERIRDALRRNDANRERLEKDLAEAEKKIDLDLLHADLTSFLREVPTRHFSEGMRNRVLGLRKRLSAARSA